jgi:hypothetical protein
MISELTANATSPATAAFPAMAGPAGAMTINAGRRYLIAVLQFTAEAPIFIVENIGA